MIGGVLTAEEVKELTGARQRARCIRVLQDNRIPFVIAADGWPRVHVDAVAAPVVSLSARRSKQPDLDAFS